MVMYKLKRIFEYARIFFTLIAAEIAVFFVRSRPEYKDLWIVSERGLDARDNGYHFFKYITQEHPEINSAYIISDSSPDRPKVAALGRVITYRSFRHYLSYLLAKVRVSTHIDGYAPDILFFNKKKFGKFVPNRSKNIFLQHGIIYSDISFCHEDNTILDMFACTAVPEFEYVEANYGYKKGIIKLTGLCRYDNLKKNDKPVRKILFMPTWRSTMRSCSRNRFLSSDYFKRYNGLLNSKELAELLDEYDYELVFYPHYEAQRFIDCFGTDNPRVKIADFQHNDVQDLLINSDILLTDYSSVYFDYGYMRKPVVYYQFDEKEFRAQQYGQGYFEYKRDGFGKVVETETGAIAELRHILENGAVPDEIYLNRMNAFYKFNDKNNCKRNFEEIEKLL